MVVAIEYIFSPTFIFEVFVFISDIVLLVKNDQLAILLGGLRDKLILHRTNIAQK